MLTSFIKRKILTMSFSIHPFDIKHTKFDARTIPYASLDSLTFSLRRDLLVRICAAKELSSDPNLNAAFNPREDPRGAAQEGAL